MIVAAAPAIRSWKRAALLPLLEEAVALQKRVWAFNEVFARYNLAACVKAALRMQGYAVGDPVPPQSPASPEACAAIAAALATVTGADASGLPSHQ